MERSWLECWQDGLVLVFVPWSQVINMSDSGLGNTSLYRSGEQWLALLLDSQLLLEEEVVAMARE